MEKLAEEKLNSTTIYEGKILNLVRDEVELSTGAKAFREVVRQRSAVVVCAITPDDKILFVKQYRYPVGEAILELPAGRLEPNEDPMIACGRELREETGYVAKTWKPLGFIHPSAGFSDEKLYLYLAKGLEFVEQKLDDGEILDVLQYSLQEVLKMIEDGTINDAKTICAITRAFLTNRHCEE